MELKNLLCVNMVVFALAGLLHLLRVVAGWDLNLGNYLLPELGSWIAIVLTAGLVYFNYQAMTSSKSSSSRKKPAKKKSRRKR